MDFFNSILERIENRNKPVEEEYDEEAALKYRRTSYSKLYCHTCRGTKTFVGYGAMKSHPDDKDSQTAAYYKCKECNELYTGGLTCKEQSGTDQI